MCVPHIASLSPFQQHSNLEKFMAASILRNWIKKLSQQLQGNGSGSRRRAGAGSRRGVGGSRPAVELLEARVVPTGAVSFNNANYASLQAAIIAAESSGVNLSLTTSQITVTGSVTGGASIGAFTNGTSGTLEITGAYGATI